jgi:hypothetical protein
MTVRLMSQGIERHKRIEGESGLTEGSISMGIILSQKANIK